MENCCNRNGFPFLCPSPLFVPFPLLPSSSFSFPSLLRSRSPSFVFIFTRWRQYAGPSNTRFLRLLHSPTQKASRSGQPFFLTVYIMNILCHIQQRSYYSNKCFNVIAVFSSSLLVTPF